MKFLFALFLLPILFLTQSCISMKYSHYEPVPLDINDLGAYSEFNNSDTIKSILLGVKSSLVVSPSLDYSEDVEVLEREIELTKKLEYIRNFKLLRELYLFNFHLSKTPNTILELKNLETLQINYFRHTNIDAECEQLKNLPRLKFLIIHSEMLSKDQILKLKARLNKVRIIDIDKM